MFFLYFQGSNDFGLIVGSVLSAMLITCTVNLKTNGQVMDNSTYVLNVSKERNFFNINILNRCRLLQTRMNDIGQYTLYHSI